jgi:signal transduction histidine kinase/CheY-like chemotaxis protein
LPTSEYEHLLTYDREVQFFNRIHNRIYDLKEIFSNDRLHRRRPNLSRKSLLDLTTSLRSHVKEPKEDSVLGELRLAQSGAVIRHLPMVIFGNGAGAVVGSMAISRVTAWAFTLALVVWTVLVPAICVFLMSRRRPQYASDSCERIDKVIAYAGLLGLVWAAIIVFCLPGSSFEMLSAFAVGCAFLAVSAVAGMYAVPLACAAYATPIFVALVYVAAIKADPAQLWLIAVLLMMAGGTAWVTVSHWNGFRKTVHVKVERIKLLADAQAAVISRNQFLENVSHEIRTPLTTMLGYTKLLRSQESQMLEAHRDALCRLDASCFSLLTVIDALLDVAKLNANQLALNDDAVFEPRKLIEGIVHSMGPAAKSKGIRLSLHTGANIPVRVHGDPERVRQIVVNLVDNAIKFTNVGSVDVTVECDAEMAGSMIDDRPAPALCIVVRDTGIGIDTEKRALIFHNFYQVDGSSRRLYGGMGLGLTVSKLLTGLMNGSLDFESDGTSGSVFKCVLPLRLCARDEGADDPMEYRAGHVLVVDDDPYIRHYLMTLLTAEGWRVHAAESGEAAVAQCGQRRFDLILMDIQMPVMTGIDASIAIWVRGAPNEHTPIVAVTGYLSTDRIAEMRAAGLVDFLAKPIVQEQLLAKAYQCAARGSRRVAT